MNVPQSSVFKPKRGKYEEQGEYELRCKRFAMLAWFTTRIFALGILFGSLAIIFFAAEPILGLLVFYACVCGLAAFIAGLAWLAVALD